MMRIHRQLAGGLLAVLAGAAIAATGAGGAQASPDPSHAPAAAAGRPATAPGSQLWAARYTGPAHYSRGYSVAVSPDGKTVFATGISEGNRYGVHADDVDMNYATAAYNATTGVKLWSARYNGYPGTYSSAVAIAVSPDGRAVFITGYVVVSSSASHADYGTVAYSATTGAQLWAARYSGTGKDNEAAAIAVSPDSRTVFVTGGSQGSTPNDDYATVAYNATTGAQVWVDRYNGPGSGDNDAAALAVSPNGNAVYVTGVSPGATSGKDYATVAYDATTGAQLWAARYNGPADGSDFADAITVSPDSGTVFVTGGSEDAQYLTASYATMAYSATSGAWLWVTRYAGPVQGLDYAESIVAGPGGNTVYVTGYAAWLNGGDNWVTLAYNTATGAERWFAHYGAAGDEPTAMALSPDGSQLYVTGYVVASGVDTTYGTVAYRTATGAQLWAATYKGPVKEVNIAYSVAVNPHTGTVYVTGDSPGKGENGAMATVAYRP